MKKIKNKNKNKNKIKIKKNKNKIPLFFKTKFVTFLALSTFITRDVIIHCYSSWNKSVPYVEHMSKLKLITHGL